MKFYIIQYVLCILTCNFIIINNVYSYSAEISPILLKKGEVQTIINHINVNKPTLNMYRKLNDESDMIYDYIIFLDHRIFYIQDEINELNAKIAANNTQIAKNKNSEEFINMLHKDIEHYENQIAEKELKKIPLEKKKQNLEQLRDLISHDITRKITNFATIYGVNDNVNLGINLMLAQKYNCIKHGHNKNNELSMDLFLKFKTKIINNVDIAFTPGLTIGDFISIKFTIAIGHKDLVKILNIKGKNLKKRKRKLKNKLEFATYNVYGFGIEKPIEPNNKKHTLYFMMNNFMNITDNLLMSHFVQLQHTAKSYSYRFVLYEEISLVYKTKFNSNRFHNPCEMHLSLGYFIQNSLKHSGINCSGPSIKLWFTS